MIELVLMPTPILTAPPSSGGSGGPAQAYGVARPPAAAGGELKPRGQLPRRLEVSASGRLIRGFFRAERSRAVARVALLRGSP